jgi:hypothetical protein
MMTLRIVAIFVIIVVSSLIFEMQNIWPFNQGRICALRAIFYAAETAAIIASIMPQYRIWGAVYLLAGFILVAAFSNATMTPFYVIIGLVCVGATFGLSLLRSV